MTFGQGYLFDGKYHSYEFIRTLGIQTKGTAPIIQDYIFCNAVM